MVGDAITLTIDVTAEAARTTDDASAVVWEVEGGQASISNEALSSNVATALITTTQSGLSVIKATITMGTQTFVQYIKIVSKEPMTSTNDYDD